MVTGFQYYTISTDKYFATEYRRIKRKCGAVGCCVVDFITNEIYRVNGYFAEFTPDFVEDVAEYWGISSQEVEEAVNCAVKEGLFCSVQFERNKVLTSGIIQERYLKISATLKRKGVAILPEYSCSISDEIGAESNETEDTPEQFGNNSGNTPEQFGNNSGTIPHSNSISMGNSSDKGNSIDYFNNDDYLNNVVLCKNSESAAEGDTKQQGGIKKIEEEIRKSELARYFFVERRYIKCREICERFYNFNASFGWQTSKGKVINPKYAAKMWQPKPEEMGGHACQNKVLASKYFDFVDFFADTHPDGAKLLSEFNNIEIESETKGVNLTYNSQDCAKILDSILKNANTGAKEAFRAHFGSLLITYTFNE